jgi:hypothetical protein
MLANLPHLRHHISVYTYRRGFTPKRYGEQP